MALFGMINDSVDAPLDLDVEAYAAKVCSCDTAPADSPGRRTGADGLPTGIDLSAVPNFSMHVNGVPFTLDVDPYVWDAFQPIRSVLCGWLRPVAGSKAAKAGPGVDGDAAAMARMVDEVGRRVDALTAFLRPRTVKGPEDAAAEVKADAIRPSMIGYGTSLFASRAMLLIRCMAASGSNARYPKPKWLTHKASVAISTAILKITGLLQTNMEFQMARTMAGSFPMTAIMSAPGAFAGAVPGATSVELADFFLARLPRAFQVLYRPWLPAHRLNFAAVNGELFRAYDTEHRMPVQYLKEATPIYPAEQRKISAFIQALPTPARNAVHAWIGTMQHIALRAVILGRGLGSSGRNVDEIGETVSEIVNQVLALSLMTRPESAALPTILSPDSVSVAVPVPVPVPAQTEPPVPFPVPAPTDDVFEEAPEDSPPLRGHSHPDHEPEPDLELEPQNGHRPFRHGHAPIPPILLFRVCSQAPGVRLGGVDGVDDGEDRVPEDLWRLFVPTRRLLCGHGEGAEGYGYGYDHEAVAATEDAITAYRSKPAKARRRAMGRPAGFGFWTDLVRLKEELTQQLEDLEDQDPAYDARGHDHPQPPPPLPPGLTRVRAEIARALLDQVTDVLAADLWSTFLQAVSRPTGTPWSALPLLLAILVRPWAGLKSHQRGRRARAPHRATSAELGLTLREGGASGDSGGGSAGPGARPSARPSRPRHVVVEEDTRPPEPVSLSLALQAVLKPFRRAAAMAISAPDEFKARYRSDVVAFALGLTDEDRGVWSRLFADALVPLRHLQALVFASADGEQAGGEIDTDTEKLLQGALVLVTQLQLWLWQVARMRRP